MQSTETGAIFAGTGSEIRMRSKKKTKKTPKAPQTAASTVIENKLNLKSSGLSESRSSEMGDDMRSNDSISQTTSPSKPSETLQDGRDKNDSLNKRGDDSKTEISMVLNGAKVKQISKAKKSKKKLKKKKQRSVQIDGVQVDNVVKMELYKKDDGDDEGDETEKKNKRSETSEDDVLMSLFRSSGIHSALKHDKIEQSGNPDYVLVEKEAERVAKQAASALKQSRAQCRTNGYSVPTWTGRSTSDVSSATTGTSSALNRKRFGSRRGSDDSQPATLNRKRFGRQTIINNIEEDSEMNPIKPKIKKEQENGFNAIKTEGSEKSASNRLDLDSESIDVSSSSLLARMRSRNAVVDTSHGATALQNTPPQTTEGRLLREIEQFVKSRPDRTATSNELTDRFKDQLEPGQNPLFKELLKQLCSLRKEKGAGYWKLKDEFL